LSEKKTVREKGEGRKKKKREIRKEVERS